MSDTISIWSQEIDERNLRIIGDLSIRSPKPFRWDWHTFFSELRRIKGTDPRKLPDLVEFGSSWTVDLIREGILVDISEVAEEVYAAHSFFPQAIDSCTLRNKVYGLPLVMDVRPLFYNEDYLSGYLRQHVDAFNSWKNFEKMCYSLKHAVQDRVIGIPHDEGGFHDILPW